MVGEIFEKVGGELVRKWLKGRNGGLCRTRLKRGAQSVLGGEGEMVVT